ncbi:MAG: sugar ABC transporter ATP-binding protein, partial [Rhodobacteraceae bacterium]|nr:sugar ABC transporter ATP-binding protein [Paracoccaceae bacterium]
FGSTLALDGASLTVEPGEVHGLIGSNGCGKSTLCKIAAGSVGADEGHLRFDGREGFFGTPAAAAAAGIAVFYQELSLIPDLDVAENIALGHEPG